MWKLREKLEEGKKELRLVFTETLQDMMSNDQKVVALEADLGGASGFSKIKNTHPKQFVEMGIAEANMVGVAAGMSMRGFIPYIHSFSPFASRRVADQVFLAGAYSGNTINIYGSDPGVCAATNGGTHTAFEDIAFYRAVPEVMIFDAADAVQLEWIIREIAKLKGVHYIRANRKAVPDIYKESSTFEIGKGNVLKEGNQVLLISMGELLSTALEAAEELQEMGINVEVIDMFTIKPFDTALLKREAKGKSLIVTFENHNIINGLGSAVAEVIAEECIPVPLRRIGVRDRFGQVGDIDYLKKEYGLTKDAVVETIKKNL